MSIKIESTSDTPEQVAAAEAFAVNRGKGAGKPAAASAKAEEQAESEDEPGASEEGEEEGTQTKDGEGDEKGEGKAGKPGKSKGGFQRKIDRLTGSWRTAERERDEARAELDRLKAERAGKVEPKKEEPKAEKTEDASKEPDPNDFDSHQEYLKALTSWQIDERERAKEKKAKEKEEADAKAKRESDAKAVFDKFQDSLKEAKERYDDFEESLKAVGDVDIPKYVRDLIYESDDGGELTYQLIKHPEDLKRICALGVGAAARELGKFEAKHLSETEESEEGEEEDDSEEPAADEPKKITKAPTPMNPVGGKGSGSVKTIFTPGLSFAEYEALRKKELAKKRA